jgi:thiamine biosynthesis lipoprotein
MNIMPSALLQRARPLLGTLVSVQLPVEDGDMRAAEAAMAQAFAAVARIHCSMSAHEPGSDLARLASAPAGVPLVLDPHTVAVLRLAQHWHRVSRGAFDPQGAGIALARQGKRPALHGAPSQSGSLRGLQWLGDHTILPDGPLALDLGGIAKGYAVDQAVAALRAAGRACGVVNAGGDLRAFGTRPWPIEVQHPAVAVRTRRLLRLREGAVASSVAAGNAEFVATRRGAARWRCGTVLARDCATADALTKWALQDPEPSLALRRALREAGARLWRN